MLPTHSAPPIYEFSNYRKYLADFYSRQKATKGGYSFRHFSRQAGFNSPNFLKLVIEGKRNLSRQSIEKLVQALGLGREEAEFFRSFVLLNQATLTEERRYYAEQLLRSRAYRKIHPLKPAQYAYCSRWYLVPIRELVTCKGFREDPEWIARALRPAIGVSDARDAVQSLLELGLLKRDGGGKLIQSEPIVSTGDEVSARDEITAAAAGTFHREMIRKGAEAIDLFPAERRDISAITIGLSQAGAARIKQLIQQFRKELLSIAAADAEPASVYQVNFQFFPVAEPPSQHNEARCAQDETESEEGAE